MNEIRIAKMTAADKPHRDHAGILRPTTRAADGLPRIQWTTDDLDAMVAHGLLHAKDRVELIRGELVPMAAKGNRHELLRIKLGKRLTLAAPSDIVVMPEPGWRPEAITYCEPDIIVLREPLLSMSFAPSEILLLIEIAESSLAFDHGLKAQIFASLGVAEYWVIDANTLSTRVHRVPTPTAYADVTDHPSTDGLAPFKLPSLSLRLADLGLD